MTLVATPVRVFSLLLILLIAACNGHMDETAEESQVFENAQISINVLDEAANSTKNLTQGNQATIRVQLQSTEGSAISQQKIEFTVDSGTLSAASRLTDSNGQAEVTFDTQAATAGVVTISASTTVNEETISIDSEVEVLTTVPVPEQETKTNLTLTDSFGNALNRIPVGETYNLNLLVTDDNNQPHTDLIVTFSAELGELNTTSALTNSSGVATVKLTAIEGSLGAATATASVNVNGMGEFESINYEIVPSGTTTSETNPIFKDNTITFNKTPSQINAGETIGVIAEIVDETTGNPITDGITVTFNSDCVEQGKATIDAQDTTINGIAEATYRDLSCASAGQFDDTIVATFTQGSASVIASSQLTILAEPIGSIEFVGAEPETIVLKGTGGQGNQETSTLTFAVKGALGNPLPQQEVTFSLSTDTGGLSLSSASGVTNSEGLVSAKVIAGTVPSAVRVTAEVEVSGQTISTQSDLLSVNTGLPDQNSISIAFSTLNPEAGDYLGVEVNVTAFMADSFNNPVPDGTTVNFTTEGGAIQPSCNTIDGRCVVKWTSQEPHIENHRVTILATAIGQESFVDANGNNQYDAQDGAALAVDVSSGLNRAGSQNTGFIDMSEAWRDDNENQTRDTGELFIDANNDGQFSPKDGLYNGPQCEGDASICANADSNEDNDFITVRKASILITSGSTARAQVYHRDTGELLFDSHSNDNSLTDPIQIPADDPATTGTDEGQMRVSLRISDTQLQVMPFNTTVTLSSDILLGAGGTSVNVNNSTCGQSDTGLCGTWTHFVVENDSSDGQIETLNVQTTTPNLVGTSINIDFQNAAL